VDHYHQHGQVEILEIGDAKGEPRADGSSESLVGLKSNVLQPEEALTQRETFRHMRALLETLSPRRQEVITLRFFGGLRNKEIAHVLDLDERTIASHLSRGLEDLREKMTTETSAWVLGGMSV
jgi:RNA polymerase sigma factor (sigma-70 family)